MVTIEELIQDFGNWTKTFPEDAQKLLEHFDKDDRGRPEVFHIFGGNIHSVVRDYDGKREAYSLCAQDLYGINGNLELFKGKLREFPDYRILHIGDNPGIWQRLCSITNSSHATGIETEFYGLIHIYPYVNHEDLFID